MLVLTLRIYQRVASPVLSAFGRPLGLGCRFTPSCSEYALEAVQKRGAWRGTGLAARRLCRCQPWGGCGYDPVPAEAVEVAGLTFTPPVSSRWSTPARQPVLGTVPRQNS